MKRFFAILPFFALLLLATSCEKHIPPQEDLLYEIELLYQPHPDSAMRILDTLNVSLLSEKERAHYCLLRARTNQISLKFNAETDSLLNEAENYYANSNEYYFAALTYLCQARQASNTGNGHDVILNYMLKASQSIEQCQNIDRQNDVERLRHEIHEHLGTTYGMCGYFKEASEHLSLAYAFYAENQEYKQQMGTAVNLGLAYLGLKEYDSSLMCLKNALNTAEIVGDSSQIAYYHHIVGYYCLYLYDFTTDKDEKYRLNLLRQSLNENKAALNIRNGKQKEDLPTIYEGIASAYYWLNIYDSTIYYAHKLIGISSSDDANNKLDRAYKHLYRSYLAIGDYENAAKYADLYIKSDRGNNADKQKAIAHVKEEYDKQLELQRIENEQHLKRMRLYLLIAILVIVLMAVFWMVFHYRKNKEVEVLKLHDAQRQLQTVFKQVKQNSQEVLEKRVMGIYLSMDENRLERIFEDFESVYPHAFEKLETNHPELTEQERNVVVLSFLRFRAKEMAELLGLTESTVQKYRSNIRKKVGNDPISEVI